MGQITTTELERQPLERLRADRDSLRTRVERLNPLTDPEAYDAAFAALAETEGRLLLATR